MTSVPSVVTFKLVPEKRRKTMAKKIKIENELYDRICQYAGGAGYSSPEEFIKHVLEKSVEDMEKSDDEEAVKERLKGLGYLG